MIHPGQGLTRHERAKLLLSAQERGISLDEELLRRVRESLAGNDLLTCDNCGHQYLTGRGTPRRSHARFCRDACRVAASRKCQREAALSKVS